MKKIFFLSIRLNFIAVIFHNNENVIHYSYILPFQILFHKNCVETDRSQPDNISAAIWPEYFIYFVLNVIRQVETCVHMCTEVKNYNS